MTARSGRLNSRPVPSVRASDEGVVDKEKTEVSSLGAVRREFGQGGRRGRRRRPELEAVSGLPAEAGSAASPADRKPQPRTDERGGGAAEKSFPCLHRARRTGRTDDQNEHTDARRPRCWLHRGCALWSWHGCGAGRDVSSIRRARVSGRAAARLSSARRTGRLMTGGRCSRVDKHASDSRSHRRFADARRPVALWVHARHGVGTVREHLRAARRFARVACGEPGSNELNPWPPGSPTFVEVRVVRGTPRLGVLPRPGNPPSRAGSADTAPTRCHVRMTAARCAP